MDSGDEQEVVYRYSIGQTVAEICAAMKRGGRYLRREDVREVLERFGYR